MQDMHVNIPLMFDYWAIPDPVSFPSTKELPSQCDQMSDFKLAEFLPKVSQKVATIVFT